MTSPPGTGRSVTCRRGLGLALKKLTQDMYSKEKEFASKENNCDFYLMNCDLLHAVTCVSNVLNYI